METTNVKKTGFFSESPDSRSMMRLMSFMLLVFLMLFDTLYIWSVFQYRIILAQTAGISASVHLIPIVDMNFILYNLVGLIGVFAPKYLQKIAELKLGSLNAIPPTTQTKTESSSVITETKGGVPNYD